METTNTDNIIIKNDSLTNFFVCGFLFFLPFSQALTINLFFPLKISEICLVLYFLSRKISNETIFISFSKVWIILYTFLLVVFISFFINIFKDFNYQLVNTYSRISAEVDSLLKYLYLLLAIFALGMSSDIIKHRSKFIKYFYYGTLFSCIYCWYLFFSGILKIPILLLPGMDAKPQSIDSPLGLIIRAGTAKEGNFMGLYLLLAGIIAIHYKKYTFGLFFLATIVTTFSSVSFICLFFYLTLWNLKNSRKSKLKKISTVLITTIIVSIFLFFTELGKSIVINKLFGTEDTIENTNDIYSKLDRLNSITVGLEMFSNNIFFGVGISNYGVHHDYYNKLPDFESNFKRIPNNIYVEILSESGIIAFSLFLSFLILLFKISKKITRPHLHIGTILLIIYFFAFPTYTMLFIWFFFGVILSDLKKIHSIEAKNIIKNILT